MRSIYIGRGWKNSVHAKRTRGVSDNYQGRLVTPTIVMVEFLPAERHARVTHTKPAAINYVAAIFAALGSFLFGYDSGIIGSVISDSYVHFHSYFKNPTEDTTGVSSPRMLRLDQDSAKPRTALLSGCRLLFCRRGLR